MFEKQDAGVLRTGDEIESAPQHRRSYQTGWTLAPSRSRQEGCERRASVTMGQPAARLAGGFLQPIDPERLQEAVLSALANSSLGELDAIKTLPGMRRAAVSDAVRQLGRARARAIFVQRPEIRRFVCGCRKSDLGGGLMKSRS
jgi:hypothetical protein